MRERILFGMGVVFFIAASLLWQVTIGAAKTHSDGLYLLLGSTFVAGMLISLALSSVCAGAISGRVTRLEEQLKKLEQGKNESC